MMLWGDTLKSTLERSQRSVQNVASRSAMLHFWNSEGTYCNTNTHKHTHTQVQVYAAFENPREHNEFADVTLACEDGQHK